MVGFDCEGMGRGLGTGEGALGVTIGLREDLAWSQGRSHMPLVKSLLSLRL
jgi:hypothetical protein